jgi:hypothetical protein
MLLDAALIIAMDVILTNEDQHTNLSRLLKIHEKLEGPQLAACLQQVKVRAPLLSLLFSFCCFVPSRCFFHQKCSLNVVVSVKMCVP